MRTLFASFQGVDVQKGRTSLLVGVSRKASAESPKGRDPHGARCAARNTSGARHSGFRASPGNAPCLFRFAVAIDQYVAGGTLAVASDRNAESARFKRQRAAAHCGQLSDRRTWLLRPGAATDSSSRAAELAIALRTELTLMRLLLSRVFICAIA